MRDLERFRSMALVASGGGCTLVQLSLIVFFICSDQNVPFLNQYENANFSHELCLIVKSVSGICLLVIIIHKDFCKESNLLWKQLVFIPPINKSQRFKVESNVNKLCTKPARP